MANICLIYLTQSVLKILPLVVYIRLAIFRLCWCSLVQIYYTDAAVGVLHQQPRAGQALPIINRQALQTRKYLYHRCI